MAFSRQFRALLEFTGLWAIPWTALGVAVAIGRWMASPDIAATVGARRLGLWSGIGGAAPPVLFAALGLIFGAPALVYLPLLGLGVVCAVGSTLLATSRHAASTRRALAHEQDVPRLPTT